MRSLLSHYHLYSILANCTNSFGLTYISRTYHSLNYTSLMLNSVANQCIMHSRDISNWRFTPSNLSKLQQLPVDEIKENYVRRRVNDAIFSQVTPTPLLTELKLVDYSEDVLANILDMDLSITETSGFLEFVAGNKVLEGSVPLAHRYGGFQFGFWANQLGDGRAILLGEYLNSKNERWELQLKGAGKTPYSRDGDGRAVLRSSIREFLASEAMHYLQIPTSRAAALVVSDDPVIRDPLYNGHTIKERAAVILRLAPSWFRFGSLEILATNKEFGLLKQLADFVIEEYYPNIDPEDDDKYTALFSNIAQRTVDTAIQWQTVGFVHGVLNTDNMSLLGITIDYGPFGFIEAYDPKMTPNHSDSDGRYRFENQMEIVTWNLVKLSIAMEPLMKGAAQKQDIMQVLQKIPTYISQKLKLDFTRKLGLINNSEDNSMLTLLFEILEENGGDFTMTFRQFAEISMDDLMNEEVIEERKLWSLHRIFHHPKYPMFIDKYRQRVSQDQITEEIRAERINQETPRYILRNWMAQSAIQKAEGNDFSEVRFIQEVLKEPFTVNEEAEKAGYTGPTPDWAHHLKVSCSS